MLIVGFGAGVTAGSFVVHPEVKRIVICEMEPLIPPTATKYFGQQNYFVLNDPRTQVIYDDARHFVLTTPEKFDIITSDPIHPWVKGSATLYSKEYFELVKQHLNPGGVITQWVPLYESDPETVKSEIATFFDAFPNGTIWGNDISGGGYDMVLMGQVDQSKIDHRCHAGAPGSSRRQARGGQPARGGLRQRGAAAGHLRRPGTRSAALARRGGDQSRRQSAAAIHGRPGAQREQGRR